jgi:hypothetical protein
MSVLVSAANFHPLHPRVLWMRARMIMVVISELLMRNIEVAPHNFLESALNKPPDKRLVFFRGPWPRSLLGQRW